MEYSTGVFNRSDQRLFKFKKVHLLSEPTHRETSVKKDSAAHQKSTELLIDHKRRLTGREDKLQKVTDVNSRNVQSH